MNQEKIGKFIAERRKQKKITQAKLAEKLGVSDKSVGNWENGRNMPDLSLFKPLCEELDISINDLISGEKLTKEEYQQKLEENIITTIDYTSKKVSTKNNIISMLLIIFGVLLSLTAMTIFPSESSWGSIYAVIGVLISLVGTLKFTKRLNIFKRIVFSIGYFILFMLILILIDYFSVITINQAPRFTYIKKYSSNYSNILEYKALFYNVYRINFDTDNEYYIIDTEKKYTIDTVPNVPFNRKKSGIENIIKYKNKYIGYNNIGNLISSLPLSEYGYTFEIDLENLELSINYNITNFYINKNYYLEKSIIYNSVSIFTLIDNVKYINYNFGDISYNITRENIEKFYPNFNKIKNNNIDKNNFNKYLENKINDNEFINNILKQIEN